MNITGVELVRGSAGAGQPSLKRPGLEVAEITIQENDDPRGVLQFNISEVRMHRSTTKDLVSRQEMMQ